MWVVNMTKFDELQTSTNLNIWKLPKNWKNFGRSTWRAKNTSLRNKTIVYHPSAHIFVLFIIIVNTYCCNHLFFKIWYILPDVIVNFQREMYINENFEDDKRIIYLSASITNINVKKMIIDDRRTSVKEVIDDIDITCNSFGFLSMKIVASRLI